MMKACRKVLNSMFNYYPEGHPVRDFLIKKASHNLVDLTGDTGIPYSNFTLQSLNGNFNTISLNDSFTPSQFARAAGVYAVYSEDGSCYVGSATDFQTRCHYYSMGKSDIMSKFQRYILDYSPNSLKWTSLVETPNYVSEFYKANPNFSAQDLRISKIIRTFTQYEARSYEQAILHAIQPNLNTNLDVLFLTKWDSNFVPSDALGSKAITAVGKVSALARGKFITLNLSDKLLKF